MVSRRKILSRSRDDLNLDQTFSPQEEEEDVWYQKDKLYKEHIQEVLDKWTQIDDEIWAKVIVFERNRRVAKAYARAPVLTINGSDDGFDGMRIGLCGFDNPMRDQKTDEFKRHIGQGVKIKMDDAGNILVRRYAKSNVYIKSTASNGSEETSIGADIMKLPNQALESEKIVKLFDMKKFQSNVNRELRRAYPDRRRLETQCLSAVAFVKSENDILECPIWVLIVNVVAMDMLKSKLPPAQRPIVDIKNRPRIPIPDEDPYSVAGNGSGGSSGSSGFGIGAGGVSTGGMQKQSNGGINGGGGMGVNNGNASNGNMLLNANGLSTGHVAATREQLLLQAQQLAHKRSEKPPKLPPRDNIYSHDIIPKPDYDDIDIESRIKLSRGKSDKGKDNKKYDDPYYCGLRARVPNFVKASKSSKDQRDHHPSAVLSNGNGNGHPGSSVSNGNGNVNNMNTLTQKKTSMIHMPLSGVLHPAMHGPPPPHMHPHHIQQQQMMAAAAAHAVHHPAAAVGHHNHHMWQTRSYESGIGSIYNPMSNAHNFLQDLGQAHSLEPHYQLEQEQQPQSLPLLPTNMNMNGHADNGHRHGLANATTAAAGAVPHHKLHQHQHQHQHQHHHRRHYHRHHSRGCGRRMQQQQQQQLPPPQLAPSYYTPHYCNNNENVVITSPGLPRERGRSRTRRFSREVQQTISPHRYSQVGSNCNCMSCYTLAPLFGAALPARPPRSLSQQQLRLHQRLSGSLLDASPTTTTPHSGSGLVKWCSESDVSELGREAIDSAYACYGKPRPMDDVHFDGKENCFDMDFDMDVNTQINYLRQCEEQRRWETQMPAKGRQTPKRQRQTPPSNCDGGFGLGFNFAARHTQQRGDETAPLTDSYVEKGHSKVRQLRSPPPPQLPDVAERRSPKRDQGTALLRNKSLSIESFFEQPTEEGSLYFYGGRKRIVKAPSTTNVYDRIREAQNSADANLNVNAAKPQQTTAGHNKKNNVKRADSSSSKVTAQPKLPPPCWRARRNATGTDSNNNVVNNKNHMRNITSPAKPKVAPANAEQSDKSSNKHDNKTDMKHNKDNNNNNNNNNNNRRHLTKNNNENGIIVASATTNATAQQQQLAQSPTPQQLQLPAVQQQQQQQRIGRSSSRLDISDMESIYGYLKPRKPRSLSLKKIQILDY